MVSMEEQTPDVGYEMSEPLRVIVFRPPSFLVRYGILLIVGAFTVLFALGFFIRYPDKTLANLTLTTNPTPVPILAPEAGLINHFFVQEGEIVERDSAIALFESNAVYQDVLTLEREIEALQSADRDALKVYIPPRNLKLGELSVQYNYLVELLSGYSLNTQSSGDRRNAGLYSQLKNGLNASINTLKEKRSLTWKEYETLKKEFSRISAKYEGSIDGLGALTDARERFLAKEQEANDIELEIKALQREIQAYDLKILSDQQGADAGTAASYFDIQRGVLDIAVEIKNWKDTHILRAPVTGKLAYYSSAINDRTLVAENERVCAILPNQETTEIVGHLILPVAKSGEVAVGQRVLVRFENYPSNTYGFVEAIITEKSTLPSNGSYFVKAAFPHGLQTSFGKTLDFRMEMLGDATIITQDRRLIHRFFSSFIGLFKG